MRILIKIIIIIVALIVSITRSSSPRLIAISVFIAFIFLISACYLSRKLQASF